MVEVREQASRADVPFEAREAPGHEPVRTLTSLFPRKIESCAACNDKETGIIYH